MNLHVVVVSSNGEGETARNVRLISAWGGTSECAACQHRLLLLVEANCAKLLPVADELIFHDEVMYGELALHRISLCM